jgi:hypothetical protein
MYKLVKNCFDDSIQCINKQDGNILLSIPINEENTDYQAYLAWLAEGNTPLPADN